MQADLFNLSISNSFEKQAFQRSFFERKYNLRVDQLVAFGLMTIVFFVLVFAWGVEHGKAVSRRDFMLQSQMSAPFEKKSDTAVIPAASSSSVAVQPVAPPAVEIASDARSEVSVPLPIKQVSVSAQSLVSHASKYTIAHVTYVKKDQALSEIDRIKSKGYAPFLVPSGRYFQICVNGFETRKDANEAIKSLRMKGIVSSDSYIRNMPAAR